MDWNIIFISIGIFNGCMISVLFMTKERSLLYFGCYLLANTLILVQFLPLEGALVVARQVADQVEWLLGPLFFFYIRSLREKTNRWKLLHLLPFALGLGHCLIPYIGIGNLEPEIFDGIENRIFGSLKVAQNFLYVGLMWMEEGRKLWSDPLRRAAAIELMVIGWSLLLSLFPPFIQIAEWMISFSIIFSLHIILYLQVKRSFFLVEKPEQRDRALDSRISDSVFQRVRTIMEHDKLYLNPQMRLADLAESTALPEKAISQAVNDHAGENVSSFINGFRVRYAEDLLVDRKYSYFTIDAIAEACGFSNKVSFYKAFRRIHHLSPKEFKERKTTENR